jgi:hypothetical protein
MTAEAYAEAFGPPSSPPIMNLLATRIMKQQIEVIRYNITEKARSPAGTSNGTPLLA